MKNTFVVGLLVSLALSWMSGCATQADLQAQDRERELLRTQLADSRATNDAIRREIERVRGELEEVRHRVDRVAKSRATTTVVNSPQIQNLEDRIVALERQMALRQEPPAATSTTGTMFSPSIAPPAESSPLAAIPAPAPSPAPSVLSFPVEDEIVLAKEPPQVQEEYRLAWNALHDQQYDKAIQQFRTFQRNNPSSELADDAQYWIGESYFNRRDYNRAILEFNDVLKYRKGDKVPTALLRQAQAFVEIGDKTDARLILQKLVNDYPNSEQAKEARERLQTLGR
ncbi:MAG: tol-pal system protein YbgF [Candidatus Binatia bacterium]